MKEYLCTVLMCTKGNGTDLEFSRSCRSMKQAQELSNWVSDQIASADPNRSLVLRFPCRRNQEPRTVVIRPDDLAAVSVTINKSAAESEPATHTAVPMGFQLVPMNPAIEIVARAWKE